MLEMRPIAHQLLDLLAVKHGKDVFVPECKDGPTWGGEHLRLDAWAMARSWTRPLTWGYEIKITRRDFMQDKKWQSYLGFCSEFYFVTTANVIKPEELPAEAGLMVASKNLTRLYTKKKAQRRQVEVPEEFYR